MREERLMQVVLSLSHTDRQTRERPLCLEGHTSRRTREGQEPGARE